MAAPSDAVDFLREVTDAESTNRTEAVDDLRFRYGDQWPQFAVMARGLERPQLTINEINSFIRRVCNQQRMARPRGKAHPVDDKGDVKVAKVVTGLGRHIEVQSAGDVAYDTAFDFAATMGWGYWRLRTDYMREDSFEQSIFIDPVFNPFTVYFDPHSVMPDGSDADRALITDMISRDRFKLEYPGAESGGFTERATGDSDPDWATEDQIRIAEYYYVDRQKSKLVQLSDKTVLWADQVPEAGLLQSLGLSVVGDRESMKRFVRWQKQTSDEVLEENTIPGRWIPIIPCYGMRVIIDGKWQKMGLVRFGRDPQRMVNFWQTSITESIALAPKAKWTMAEGQDEGHVNEWANANLNSNVVLRYKQTDVDGRPAPPPTRVQPEPPPSGAIDASFMASMNLQKALGIFDPAVRGMQHKSDETLNAESRQSESTNFDLIDNLNLSIKHSWRVMLSWFPFVYDTERVQRIIGEDGKPELVTINQKQMQDDGEGHAIQKVLNCVCVGDYDVVMETGPGFDTKRQEGLAAMLDLMKTPIGPQVAAVGSDLVVRQVDAHGMDVLADRLAAANPLSKVDEQSDVPPQAQMQMQHMQKMLEEATKEIEQLQMQLKYRSDIEGMKQEGETRRKLMDVTARANDTEQRSAAMNHSTEVKAVTAQNVAELQGLVKLLSEKLGAQADEFAREADRLDAQQAAKHAEQPTVN